MSPHTPYEFAILWLGVATFIVGGCLAVRLPAALRLVLIILGLALGAYGSGWWSPTPGEVKDKTSEVFKAFRKAAKETLSGMPEDATPTPRPAPTATAAQPSPTPTPPPSPTATVAPRASPVPTFRRGYYYLRLLNRTNRTIMYRAMNAREDIALTPYNQKGEFYTHWWSSPDNAKIQILGRSDSAGAEKWHSLETEYFDHEVSKGSNERDLIPVYEIFEEGGRIDIRKAPSSVPERETFYDEPEEPVTWPYYADLRNVTRVTLVVEHLQGKEWVQLKLKPGELQAIGADSATAEVRVCQCEDKEPASLEGWSIDASKPGRLRPTHEFYVDRHGKVNLRTVSR